MHSPDLVSIKLTPEEALVLHEYLQRFSMHGTLAIEDQAEERALWNLCCLIEQELLEPLTSNYAAALAHARNKLRDPSEAR